MKKRSLRREHSRHNQKLAERDSVSGINVQYGDRRSPLGSDSDESRADPIEMPLPALPPGIEQPSDSSRRWVNAGEITRFCKIA
jgi:hypothetical protein